MSITISIGGVPMGEASSVEYEPIVTDLDSGVEALPKSYEVSFDVRVDRAAWKKLRRVHRTRDARDVRRKARVRRARVLGDHRRWRGVAEHGPFEMPHVPRMGMR